MRQEKEEGEDIVRAKEKRRRILRGERGEGFDEGILPGERERIERREKRE